MHETKLFFLLLTGILPGVVANNHDQFDSYLTKLQTICTENGQDSHKPTYCGTPGPPPGSAIASVATTPKTALQAYNSAAKI